MKPHLVPISGSRSLCGVEIPPAPTYVLYVYISSPDSSLMYDYDSYCWKCRKRLPFWELANSKL